MSDKEGNYGSNTENEYYYISCICISEPSAKPHMFKIRAILTDSFVLGVGEGLQSPHWNLGSNPPVKYKWLSTGGETTCKPNHSNFKLSINSPTFISVHHTYFLRYL